MYKNKLGQKIKCYTCVCVWGGGAGVYMCVCMYVCICPDLCVKNHTSSHIYRCIHTFTATGEPEENQKRTAREPARETEEVL